MTAPTAPASSTTASNALADTFFNWDLIARTFPRLLTEGLLNTLVIAAGAIVLGIVIALLAAMLLLSKRWWVRLPARLYVDVFRGLPVIITVMLVGVGLPAAGIRPFGTDPFGYAILAIGIISGAYTAEIFRSGIQSVDTGQLQAARSLGMSYLTAMRLVVVPQGVRRVLPAMAGQFVKDIKESSLVYLLGLAAGQRELYFIAQEEVARTYNSSPSSRPASAISRSRSRSPTSSTTWTAACARARAPTRRHRSPRPPSRTYRSPPSEPAGPVEESPDDHDQPARPGRCDRHPRPARRPPGRRPGQELRQDDRAAGHHPRRPPGRDPLPHRPVRLRQVHAPEVPQPAGDPRLGRDLAR
ncbi:ABC transporter permease subunit [Streptomyces sp. MB09-02B]|uniref:amino acid ABC transporter permease n=1 Tax=Streptomyces sp. MB09-02B TaxID=3028667 RepID=UPI0029C044A0|nr:ABC transporter permease subunit [Streptomyces sp. MB09-02B]